MLVLRIRQLACAGSPIIAFLLAMRALPIVVCFVISYSLEVPIHADENKHSEDRAARIEALIDKLAVAQPSEDSSAEDKRSRNAPALEAWIELRDIGPEAFQKVVEHLQDKRTSFTEDSGSMEETWTVGRACLRRALV